jgi:UDP-N-acetylglucosamine--N-acetylmuramyl-(pentapeptide) pyrophosphoryl-undecaprenol N-acetylglucosamine transferase
MTRSVLFAGGGSGGPVTPLLAVASQMLKMDPEIHPVWAGTDTGPERDLVEPYGFPYFAIPIAKLPRYLTTQLLTAPFDYFRARRTARDIMRNIRPSVVISAGGFTAVPVVHAANAFGVPCISHQLDCVPGLSNRLIARHSRIVSTSFEYSDEPFGRDVISTPIPTPTRFGRNDLPSHEEACAFFHLDPLRITLFVTGGGTGAISLNRAMEELAEGLLPDMQIIHLTGKGKNTRVSINDKGYIRAEFFTKEMIFAYAAADLVVSRAGIGAIAELAACAKPVILIPLPDSPQEANAGALNEAVRIVEQEGKRAWIDFLGYSIRDLIENASERVSLGEALYSAFPTDRGEALAEMAFRLM